MPPISFDLHKLGWKSFQGLVGCIFDEVMGQTFKQFSDGPDEGRDGAFHGQWTPQNGEVLSGTFTIQCKHTSNINKTLTKSVIDEELPKIKRLSTKGLVDNYIFVTNHTITSEKEQDAKKCFEGAGAKYACVYGPEWVNTKIVENPKLRRLIPRLYGLGDLTQIVTHQAYLQASAVLDDLVPDLQCFVSTDAYKKSARALNRHRAVLLLGEPGSGKTTIANLLALSAADEWNLQTVILSGPEDLDHLFNPADPGQFLWVDDAFGATQYDPTRAQEWNQRLKKLKAAIKQGTRLVFTSRDYIFNAAKNDLTLPLVEFFEDNQIIIKVEELTVNERQMILYNHLKCGTQPKIFRKRVKPWLEKAAATQRFLPEVARRFANPKYTKGMSPNRKDVIDFFENPVIWLEGTLSKFAAAEKAALALIFIAGGRLPVPIPKNEHTLHTIETMQSTFGAVKAGLNALNNALIRRIRENGCEYWCFQHPTIRDAFASLVGANPEFIDIYLVGTPAEKLMNEVTCGDMSQEGVKIIVPPDKYSMIIKKINEIERNSQHSSDPVSTFLAHRCGSDFLEKYFTECEPMTSLPDKIVMLDSRDESIRILNRLYLDKKLPEEIRLAMIKKIYSLAEVDASYYLFGFIKEKPFIDIMTEEEKNTIKTRIKNIVLSKGYDLIYETSQDWSKEDEPRDFFSEYEDTLISIKDEAEEERSKADKLIDYLYYIIDEMENERDSSKQSDHYPSNYGPDYEEYYHADKQFSSGAERLKARLGYHIISEATIFEDVDE